MSVSGISPTTGTSSGALVGNSSSLSQSDFYKIITTELENQDPENATDPNQMVQDMMSLSTYQASQTESSTLSELQNYSTATSLLGKTVNVTVPASTDSSAQSVNGSVDAVQFSGGAASITVNGSQYPVGDVTSVSDTSSTSGGN